MSYYAGGYYAGGYYAGGFLGNLFRGATKIIGGAILGGITKGPVGAVTGAAAAIPSAVAGNIRAETLSAGNNATAWTPELQASHDAALARGGNAVASAAKPSTAMVPAGVPMMNAGMAGVPGMVNLRGYHPNRSTYVVRGGGTSHYPPGINIVVKGTSLVKNRHMNWGNGKALARAERRIGSFLNHATKYMRWAKPNSPGKAVPKFPKRRKK